MVKFMIRAETRPGDHHYESARKYVVGSDHIYSKLQSLKERVFDSRAEVLSYLARHGANSACETHCENTAYPTDHDAKFAEAANRHVTGMVEFITLAGAHGHYRMGNGYKIIRVRD